MLLKKIEIILKNKIELVLFFFISLLVTFPWFIKSGYVFFTDFVFGPQIDLTLGNHLLYINILLYVTKAAFGGPLTEKLFIFSILFFTQLSGYLLASLCSKEKITKCIVAIFMVINPFFYDRFMYGQFGVILGLTFLVYSFYFLNIPASKKSIKNTSIAGALFGFSILSAPHYIFIGSFFIFLHFIFYFSSYNIRQVLSFLSSFLLVTIFWMYQQFFREGDLLIFTKGIDNIDLVIFQTVGSSVWQKIMNVFLMFGFWGSKQHRYFDLQGVTFWWRSFIILIPAIILGGVSIFKANRKFFYFLLVVLLSTVIFSIASSIPSLKKILYDTVPFYKSIREPQKWVSLIVLVYAVCLAFSIDFILKLKNKYILIFMLVLSIVTLTPFIFIVAYGQIKSQNYPDSWVRANDYIVTNDQCQHETLILPWHLYMSFSFNENRITAHPAKNFFTCKVINGTNMEWGGIYDNSRSEDGNIYGLFATSNGKGEVPTKMKYIIVTKDIDYKEYSWLNKLKSFKKIKENDDLIMYEKI